MCVTVEFVISLFRMFVTLFIYTEYPNLSNYIYILLSFMNISLILYYLRINKLVNR